MDIDSLPDKLGSILAAEVAKGEVVAWIDRPGKRAFAGLKVAIFLFGLLWTAMSIGFAVVANGTRNLDLGGPADYLPLLAIPFVLMGVAFMSIPVWVTWLARSVVYAITDRRVLIIGRIWAWRITTIPPERIGTISRMQRDDGSGTVTFCLPASSEGAAPVAFQEVADARGVEMMLRRLAETANP